MWKLFSNYGLICKVNNLMFLPKNNFPLIAEIEIRLII
jgi:hypothetical protein